MSIWPRIIVIQRRRGAGCKSENSDGAFTCKEQPVQVFSVSRMGSSWLSSSMALLPSAPVYMRKMPIALPPLRLSSMRLPLLCAGKRLLPLPVLQQGIHITPWGIGVLLSPSLLRGHHFQQMAVELPEIEGPAATAVRDPAVRIICRPAAVDQALGLHPPEDPVELLIRNVTSVMMAL